MQNLDAFLTPKLPDYAAIAELVAGERPGFAVDAKAVILDANLSPFALPNPPNPADSSDVSSWVLSAKVDRNVNRDVMTQCDLVLDAKLADQVNTLKVWLQFFTVYYDMTDLDADGNPDVLAAFPRCIVGFQIPDRLHDDQGGGETLKVTGYDESWRLRDLYFQNPFTPPGGMHVTDIVVAMMEMDQLTPSEGGRAPSGITSLGPHANIPVGDNVYCAVGSPIHVVCSTIDSQGNYVDPAGLFVYNPDSGALLDPTTHFPIDPWTCHPMTFPVGPGGLPDMSQPNTCLSSKGLWYNTKTGGFYLPGYPAGTAMPYDPYKGQPVPAGYVYEHPDPDNPSATLGNIPCPLQSWPYDFDGSGPYFGVGGVPTSSSGGGTTTGTSSGPSSVSLGAAATIASRDGTGSTTLISAGTYTIQAALCSNDPVLPGHNWCQPRGGIFASASGSVAGYDWPAGTWTISLSLLGVPVPGGQAAISADLYLRNGDGSLTLLGNFPEGSIETFTPGVAALTLSCSDSIAHIIAGAGATLVAHIALDTVTALTCDLGAGGSGAFAVSSISVSFPTPTITTTTTDPIVISGGNGGATLVSTGTWVPWPDANAPGMCPNGCETPGPNIPSERITMTEFAVPLGTSTPFSRDTNFLAALDQMLAGIAYRNVYHDEVGQYFIVPKPLFSVGIPEPVWSFRTDTRRVIKPPLTQRLADQTGLFNKVVFISENNALPSPIVRMGTNMSLGSAISIPNLDGRVIMGKPIQNDAVMDVATADLIVEHALQAAASAYETLEMTAADVPFLQPYDPVEVFVQSIDGVTQIDSGPFSYFIDSIVTDLMDPTSAVFTLGRAVPI